MATESSESEEEGRIKGGEQHLIVDEDLRELGKKAAWSVSSCKPCNGVTALRDDNLETYWQSDGAQPHMVNIQFQKKVKLQLVVLYVDFKLDESYTPSKISVRAGDGFHNLKTSLWVRVLELLSVGDKNGVACQANWLGLSIIIWIRCTESYSPSAVSVYILRVHNLLDCEMTNSEVCEGEWLSDFRYRPVNRVNGC